MRCCSGPGISWRPPTFRVRGGSKLHQVSIPALVLAEHHEMIGTVSLLRLIETVRGGNVDFTPYDGLQSVVHRRLMKLYRSEKITVVGDRYGRVLQFPGAVHQPRHLARTIQQAVIGVKVKVNEIG